jgi:uncharacterized protein YaeQ
LGSFIWADRRTDTTCLTVYFMDTPKIYRRETGKKYVVWIQLAQDNDHTIEYCAVRHEISNLYKVRNLNYYLTDYYS